MFRYVWYVRYNQVQLGENIIMPVDPRNPLNKPDVVVEIEPISGSVRLVDTITGNYGWRGVRSGGLNIMGSAAYNDIMLDYSAGPNIVMGNKDRVLHSVQMYFVPTYIHEFLESPESVPTKALVENPKFRWDVFQRSPTTGRWEDSPMVSSFVYEKEPWNIEYIPWKWGKITTVRQGLATLFTVCFDPVVLQSGKEYLFTWNPDVTDDNYQLVGRPSSMGVKATDGTVMRPDFLVRWVNFNKKNPTAPNWIVQTSGTSDMYPTWIINVLE